MKKKVKAGIGIIVILTCIIVVIPQIHAGEETVRPDRLTFVYTRPEDQPVTRWLIMIYTDALNRLNIELVFKDVPPVRASSYSNRGLVDGELSRIYDYNTKYPNLVRVEEHNALVSFSAFSKDSTITLEGWDSLKETDFNVEYRRGVKKCAEKLVKLVPSGHLSEINTREQGIRKLLAGRTDIYVDVEDFVMKYLNSQSFKKVSQGKIIHKAGVMEKTTGHAWLHKKHLHLAPQLAAILRDMKKEGLFETYREQVGLTHHDIKW